MAGLVGFFFNKEVMQPTQTEIFANTDLLNIFFQYAIQSQTGKQRKVPTYILIMYPENVIP